MKIYTRTGDQGQTSLFGGPRVSKTSLRIEAYGTVDELNSHLGLARALAPHPVVDADLLALQQQLFRVGADLATPLDTSHPAPLRLLSSEVAWLEQRIDVATDRLPPLTQFILPGGTPAASALHVARTVCRRAERVVCSLTMSEEVNVEIGAYLNRLSDLLFTLARLENSLRGVLETGWSAEK